MIYPVLIMAFLVAIWAFDVIYFSQKESKNHKNIKRLKDSYKANRNF